MATTFTEVIQVGTTQVAGPGVVNTHDPALTARLDKAVSIAATMGFNAGLGLRAHFDLMSILFLGVVEFDLIRV